MLSAFVLTSDLKSASFCRVMNLYMNASVETCRDLLSIIDIRTASVLHMVNLSRSVD